MSAVAVGAPRHPSRRPGRDPRAVWRELRVLLRFRLGAGGRDPRRAVVVIAALVVVLGILLPTGVAFWAPRDHAGDIAVLSPTLWTFVLVAALVASLASAGGRELLPRRDAVALPVSPTADQVGALLLTPLNVAWSLQAVGVLTAAAYVIGPVPMLPATLLASMLWLFTATALAQLLGWLAEVVRTYRHGARSLQAALALLGAAALLGTLLGDVGAFLDRLPTTEVFIGAVATSPSRYLLTQAAVLLTGLLAVVLAVPVAELLTRRPTPVESSGETRARRRRTTSRSALATAVGVDVRSIVRSPPLRRGLTLLLLTPVVVALLLPLPWVAIVVLPALVVSGAALMHGVNTVSLDGRGALWRESLPHDPDVTLVGRLAALSLLCGGSASALVLIAGLRAGAPTAGEAAAAGTAVLVTTMQVVSRCARWSIRHPFTADLRGGRDAPAPPVAMAGYSVRLSVVTTLAALLVASGAVLDSPALALAIGSGLVLPSLLRLQRAFRSHRDLATRSRVAATVVGA